MHPVLFLLYESFLDCFFDIVISFGIFKVFLDELMQLLGTIFSELPARISIENRCVETFESPHVDLMAG